MHAQALLEEIATVLPPVEKPGREDIAFHKSGCDQCNYLRKDLEQYQGKTLPDEAIRYLHNEWSCLSAAATRWVLPSYLVRCLTQDTYDPLETEFLIYTLAPEAKYELETTQRLSKLSHQQIGVLRNFMAWCREHPHWSTYCPTEVARGSEFIERLWVSGSQPNKSLERTRER
jgi:hypothetical protein